MSLKITKFSHPRLPRCLVENKKDLLEIPEVIKKNIEIVPVKNVDEVLKLALTKPFKRVEWVELEKVNNENKTGASSRH